MRELLKAHEYLRRKGFAFDLVVLNEHAASYLQDLQDELLQMVESSPSRRWIDKPGGVFLRRADLMPPRIRLLLRAAARVVMDAADGGLREPARTRPACAVRAASRRAIVGSRRDRRRARPAGRRDAAGRRPRVVQRHRRVRRRRPRVRHRRRSGNGGAAAGAVVERGRARRRSGSPRTESAPGYTWSENSHDNRLTPWRNDPVGDPPGEALFIRDEETGAFWSATPLPAGRRPSTSVRHGQGYSVYEHARDGIASTLTAVRAAAPSRSRCFASRCRTTGAARGALSVTLYVEWVLGENRSRIASARRHQPRPGDRRAVWRATRFRQEFAERVAFLDLRARATERDA